MEKYKVSYIDLNTGEKIAYRKAGNGLKTFVLIHGNISSSVWFEELMEGLSKDYTLYALDLPGFGDSSYNRVIKSLYDLSRDVTEFIIKLNLDDVILLGWSTGGGVALETAANIPGLIDRVILLSSVSITGYPMYKRDIFAPFSTEYIRTREEMFRYNALVSPMMSMFRTSNKHMLKKGLELMMYGTKAPDDALVDKYVCGAIKQRNYVDILTALVNFNMTNMVKGGIKGSDRAKLIKAYVHVIHGDQDKIADVEGAVFTSKYLGLQADLKIFRGCGHSIVTDNYDGLITYLKTIVEDGLKYEPKVV
ncbi:MAG: alpha/beta hydrolase [Tissierellia bacterium]|nr:alpha/beta hydrolase [Tissierellia bacterium]